MGEKVIPSHTPHTHTPTHQSIPGGSFPEATGFVPGFVAGGLLGGPLRLPGGAGLALASGVSPFIRASCSYFFQ